MSGNSFGTFLKNLREEKKLRQKDLAAILSVSVSTISKWENDINHPDLSSLRDLSKKCDISLESLLHHYFPNLDQEETTIDDSSIKPSVSQTLKEGKEGKTFSKKKLICFTIPMLLIVISSIVVYLYKITPKCCSSIKPFYYCYDQDEILGKVRVIGIVYSYKNEPDEHLLNFCTSYAYNLDKYHDIEEDTDIYQFSCFTSKEQKNAIKNGMNTGRVYYVMRNNEFLE